jgi:O-acetyl-ADP-ribose deacetylase (regulator of RNase III)
MFSRQGDIEKAVAAYAEAQKLDPTIEIPANVGNNLCWWGSLWGHAADVIDACETAVALEPENGKFRDSRGLARSLTGNIAGAIEDFHAFVDWTDNEEKRLQRQRWIDALRAGDNPFTEEEIESLFNEHNVAHPEELKEFEVCKREISSVEAGRNVVGENDVEIRAIASSSSTPVVPGHLTSERGIDYTRLCNLLRAEQWQEAERETTALMLRISGREAEGCLREEDIENFPCTDLLIIDQLWVKYSEGRFGFSVQKEIWQNIGGTLDADYKIALKLAECHLQPPAPTTVEPQRLVTTISNKSGSFLGEFFIRDKTVRIYQGDITNLVTDVIVSSDGTYLKMNGGVSYRIRQIGGEEIYKQTRNLIPSSLGNIAVTTAGKLKAKKIFHGVVIDRRNKILPSQDVIQQVVRTCIETANQYGFQSIAFPLLGTGAGRLPAKVAWESIVLQIIRELSDKNQTIPEVVIVLYERIIVKELNVESFLERINKSGWRLLVMHRRGETF